MVVWLAMAAWLAVPSLVQPSPPQQVELTSLAASLPTAVPVAITGDPPTAPSSQAAPTGAELASACESASEAGNWTAAVTACELAREVEPSYPGLTSALARAYVGLGTAQLANARTDQAAELFGKALAVAPRDAEAGQQQQRLTAYQEGSAALAAGDWPVASHKLQEVYDAVPDYLERSESGGVKQRLYEAYLGWGQALLKDRAYGEARRRCQDALALQPDSPEATACAATVAAALATPTPLPPPSQPRPAQTRLQEAPPAQQSRAPEAGTQQAPRRQTPPQQGQPQSTSSEQASRGSALPRIVPPPTVGPGRTTSSPRFYSGS